MLPPLPKDHGPEWRTNQRRIKARRERSIYQRVTRLLSASKRGEGASTCMIAASGDAHS